MGILYDVQHKAEIDNVGQAARSVGRVVGVPPERLEASRGQCCNVVTLAAPVVEQSRVLADDPVRDQHLNGLGQVPADDSGAMPRPL